MKDFEKKAKPFLSEWLAEITDVAVGRRVYAELKRIQGNRLLDENEFLQHWLPYRYALGCVCWVEGCLESNIEDKKFRNLFFQSTMEVFDSPERLPEATAFSEYLYAANSAEDEKPRVVLAKKLCERLRLGMFNDDRQEAISPAFRLLFEASEGFRAAFENEFQDRVVRTQEGTGDGEAVEG